MEKLTTSNYIVLVGGVGAAILTLIGHILIREWYQPDVRYEQGSYYRSVDLALVSLKLTNYGHSDAEEIIITTTFPEPIIKDIATGDEAIPFTVKSGGINSRTATGQILRLVPEQSVYLYYAMKNPVGPITEAANNFVNQVYYKGGKGQTGQPWLRGSTFLSWSVVVIIFLLNILTIFANIRTWSNLKEIEKKLA